MPEPLPDIVRVYEELLVAEEMRDLRLSLHGHQFEDNPRSYEIVVELRADDTARIAEALAYLNEVAEAHELSCRFNSQPRGAALVQLLPASEN